MDEQQARQRLLEGGYFVALGVPPGVEFGIDLKSYTVGGRLVAAGLVVHQGAALKHQDSFG